MTLTDEQFRDEFKPLHVPASYDEAAGQENKVLFALALLGEGSAEEVLDKLEELEPGIRNEQFAETTKAYLQQQFDKGLLNGGERSGRTCYNLDKVTRANEGSVDPDLLAPGLD